MVSLMNDDDDVPQLSAETFSALSEFYKEQEDREKKQEEVRCLIEGGEDIDWKEDWQLSQFWYVVFSYWDQLLHSQSHHISMCLVVMLAVIKVNLLQVQ